MNLTDLTNMHCEIIDKKEDRNYYKGSFKVNEKDVQIFFNRKDNERFFVRTYSVDNEDKEGSNIIEFLQNQGLETSRKDLFERLLATINS